MACLHVQEECSPATRLVLGVAGVKQVSKGRSLVLWGYKIKLILLNFKNLIITLMCNRRYAFPIIIQNSSTSTFSWAAITDHWVSIFSIHMISLLIT